jgi:demethoxyubiquinone hydroxylase (CLK1/Coq7/Cat5 family)
LRFSKLVTKGASLSMGRTATTEKIINHKYNTHIKYV